VPYRDNINVIVPRAGDRAYRGGNPQWIGGHVKTWYLLDTSIAQAPIENNLYALH